MIEFILWYLVIAFVGLLALPVAFRFFSFLSDRGYTLARTLGLLLWGYLFWVLTSLRVLQNDLGGVLVALALLGGLSWWAGRGLQGWREFGAWVKGRVRLVVVAEVLFLLAFAFLAVLRAAGPQISGTEKPMELAFINAILRSPSFPPADPWLSGYSISYYYFGYVLVAMLTRVTGVVSGIAFNLAIALVFALAALGAYGIVHTLLASWSRRRQAAGKRGIFSQGWALLAPLFILVMANLEGGLEVMHAGGLFWQDNGLAKRSEFWNWVGLQELNQPPAAPYDFMPKRAGGIWWWRASRVLSDYNMTASVQQAVPGLPFSSYLKPSATQGPNEVIDEFPFFSFYLGDLHPHVLAIPFVLLAIALALNQYLSGAQVAFGASPQAAGGLPQTTGGFQHLGSWVSGSDFWLAAVVLGGLAFLNTWDFPIYLALYSAVYTLIRFQQVGWKWWPRLWDFGQRALVLGIAGIALYVPFYLGFASQAGGVLPSLAFFTRGLHFWVMFGVLLTPLVFWLVWLASQQQKRHQFSLGLRFAVYGVGGLWIGAYLLGIIGLNLSALGGLAASGSTTLFSRLANSLSTWGNLFLNLQGGNVADIFYGSLVRRVEMPGTWLTLLLLLAGVWALLASFRPRVALEMADEVADAVDVEGPQEMDAQQPTELTHMVDGVAPGSLGADMENPALGNPHGFVLLLVLVGIGLTLVPEFVYLRDQFGWRMNTIFKFYYQTWVLWGLAAAFATALLWSEMRGYWAWAGRALTVGLCLVGLIYPVVGLSERLNPSQVQTWTLDGTDYIARYDKDEKDAMNWLAQAPYGTLVEAVGGSYGPAARMATHSGLPTLLGWPGHESQWRGGAEQQGSRQDDISRLYRTRDWNEAKTILARYGVRYVVVGQLERNTYLLDDQKGLRALDELKFQKNLKAAFQNTSVTIYEVSQRISAGK